MGAPIAALPNNQFVIQKADQDFAFYDPTGKYPQLTLREALAAGPANHSSKPAAWTVPAKRLVRQVKDRFHS